MLSGRRLDLLDPSPLDIEVIDVAQGLARVSRWNGQTTGKWAMSVAEHSLLVEQIAAAYRRGLEYKWRLAALLHDGPEYVIGDTIRPLKQAKGYSQEELEGRLQRAIHQRFGLPEVLPRGIKELIKRADRAAAYMEGTQLAGYDPAEARQLWGVPRLKMLQNLTIKPMPQEAAAAAFEKRCLTLYQTIRKHIK